MSCLGCCSADDGDGPLGDVLAEVADALEIGRDAQRRHDLTQIVGHRLPPGDHHHGLLFDLTLDLIDFLVLVDGGGGEFGIAPLQGLEGLAEYLLGEAAHLGDLVVEERKLLLVRPDDVVVLLVHGELLKRRYQPKRPVT